MSINSLQFTKMKFNSSMTESNNLAQALLVEPAISKTLAYIFGPEKYALTFLTQGMGRLSTSHKSLIGSREFRWPLMGQLTKAVRIVSQVSGGSQPGIGRTPFKLKLGEKLFGLGDVVATDSRVLLRVQEDPIQDGTDFIFTFQLVSPDAALFVPLADLAADKELSKEFSAYEEYSKGGNSTEATPMWFQNQMTTMRKSFAMTGGAQTDVMVLQVGGRDGKKGSFLWLYEKEYQFMLQWREEVERMLWYSLYNRDSNGLVHLPGANGRPVLLGAGLLQQIAPSNTRTYADLTEKVIREFLNDLRENARESQAQNFIAFTGWWGMDAFDQAMKDSASKFTLVDSKFITGSGQEMTLGGAFKTYIGTNGMSLTVKHNPLYDNPVNNRKLHPITKKPLESYRFTILDFGMYGGESNVSLVAKGADGIDRSMLSWYTAGSQTPAGGDAGAKGYMNAMRSNDLDGWSVHFLSECGIKVVNPLSCGELLCVKA